MLRTRLRAWKQLRTLLTVAALASFLLLMPSRFTAPARVLFNEALNPVQTGVFQGAGDLLAASGTLTEMFRRTDGERALAQEVTRLRNANAALAEQVRQQQLALKSAAGLQVKEFPFDAVHAPVSSYDSSAMSRSITVRAGKADGVAPGMAVAADGALVGLVVEAGRSQCRVRLITDPASAVPCRVSSSRAVCILQGTGGQALTVDWVDSDAFAEPADSVVTASLSIRPQAVPPIPEGLPAATVLRVERDPLRPLFLSVEAAPRVDLDRLEAVQVLIPRQEEPPGPARP
jgi:rod shape-determining protein MreC